MVDNDFTPFTYTGGLNLDQMYQIIIIEFVVDKQQSTSAYKNMQTSTNVMRQGTSGTLMQCDAKWWRGWISVF